MKYIDIKNISVEVKISHFESALGDEAMAHITILDTTLSFEEQLSIVIEKMKSVCDDFDGATVVFRRFFVSDAANQTESIIGRVADLADCATSIVEQPPLDGTKLAVWIYLQSGVEMRRIEGSDLYSVTKGDVVHLWCGTLFSNRGVTSREQMRDIFKDYIKQIERVGCTLIDNCIRTWLFVQNVDVNYAGVVTGRNEIFDEEGLVPESHFITSTGIQGRSADHNILVQMDSYSVAGISRDQIQFLYAPTHLNSTYEYGVRFERGVAVHYTDRSHAFISGTASIDNRGEVVHEGDIRLQTLRMWENVEVLLSEADFTPSNIANMIVYLRDIADYAVVKAMFEERFPDTPKVITLAPVCRPKWLIEMECIAIR